MKFHWKIMYTALCVLAVLAGAMNVGTDTAGAGWDEAPEPVVQAAEAPLYITRQEAAARALAALEDEGWSAPAEGASLAMFADAADAAPWAARALAELVRLGVFPVEGAFLRPGDLMTEEETLFLNNGMERTLAGEQDPLAALGDRRQGALEATRSVCAALLSLGLGRFEGEPDSRLTAATLQLAAFSGLCEGCELSGDTAVFTRSGMALTLEQIFAAPAPEQLDPTGCQPPPEVLGEQVRFTRADDRIALSPGALVPDGEGFTLWCTLYKGGKYYCTALVKLEGSAVASVQFSFG